MRPLSDARRKLLDNLLKGEGPQASRDPLPLTKRAGTGPAPLSYGQRQIWLHSSFAGDIPLYNEPVTLHRLGPLDIPALERSLCEFVRRQEAWRTSFEWGNDEPVQIVHPPLSNIRLQPIDLREIPESQRQKEALRIATQDAILPFDLSRVPLFRIKLLRMADSEYRLHLTLHHIIFDGVTLHDVFVPELLECYEAFSAGKAPRLPDLPIQYADYTFWQEQWVERVLPDQTIYWKEVFSGDWPVLDLRTDRPRPSVQTYNGAVEKLVVSNEITESLRALSQRERVTMFTTLVAAFYVFLYRRTGQEDLVIGSTTGGRNRPNIQKVAGYFLNTIVLRTRASSDLRFTDLLARVRDTTLGALSHDAMPFELLVKTFQALRDPSRTPLFQVLFSLEPPLPPLRPGWKFTQMDVDTGTSKVDLHLSLDDRPTGLAGGFFYNTDVFEPATIARMKSDWLLILKEISADPSQRISEPVFRQDESQVTSGRASARSHIRKIWSLLMGRTGRKSDRAI